MRRLLIAAGGGGDAITAALLHSALYGADTPALVLTYAWERLVVDPVPGPRGAGDFTGLDAVAPGVDLITAGTAPLAPAGSLLPRLAAGLRPRLGLLDPHGGTLGLARQIAAAAAWCQAGRVDLVDVGGDIVARGDEPTLRSPLGDALALAACAAAALPTTVYVAGPGLDNEIPLPLLLPRLGAPALGLESRHTDGVLPLFDWHPSEASALLVAAARGARGVCGTRDAPAPLTLDDTARHVHRLTLEQALDLNPLARRLAGCGGLAGAEAVSEAVCGFSEIARERARAAALPADVPRPREPADAAALTARFAEWERRTAAQGLTHVTSRRIAEELELSPPEALTLFGALRRDPARPPAAPLWRLLAD
ncbi:hypothetical protein C6N75_11980 [Streptomyces solincola]|uniref:DUF1152 domain-containing protein n=1 Tax=Streptomyces solincola TaxID=2100817 RepID=A0A2S9PX27_9ACTN|nr:DUF1152 domain-containing protein [Streptomyces solincola]PRH78986.1 hypothetical protein C6N75_11980 [Streptomyces solincola]